MNMFRHHLIVAARNLVRQRVFSLINIAGLALGLTSALFILLWIQDELRVDNFHENGDRLYRVYMRIYNGENMDARYHTPALLPEELKKVIPEVEYASGFAKELRLSRPGLVYETFQVGDTLHKMRGGRAGQDFFKMFSYPILHGTAETALNDPTSVAISRKMAVLFFGSPENAFGETILFNNENNTRELVVTAVFEDIPATSSDQFDYLTHWDEWVQNDDFKKSWGHFGTHTYIQLKDGANPEQVEAKVMNFLNTYMTMDDNFRIELGLQRFGDQYLYGNFDNGIPANGRITYVRLLSAVTVFILLIACINLMNLTTARSLKRAREIGIRKVVGATRFTLVRQFIGETFLLTFIAVVVALLLVSFAMPWFNILTGKQIALTMANPLAFPALTVLVLVVSLIAGSYPAFFLSAFPPLLAIKGALRFGSGANGFRRGLVVFQFVLSLLLIVATIVVTMQTAFVESKNLGYDRENIIYIHMEGALLTEYLTFKKEALRMPGIKHVDRSSQSPHRMGVSGPFVRWAGMPEPNPISFTPNSVGFDYVKLMGMKIVAGRDFSPDFPADSTNFLVSELAVRLMDLKDPIGTVIQVFGKTGTIVGVINDFHTQSLHQPIRPTILDVKENLNFGTLLVRTEAGKAEEALASLEEVCARLNPGYAFTYSFLDDEYHNLYKSEQMITKLSNIFGALAILISCLGLLGLTLFAAEQRVKEMGIRKVLGASAGQLFALFSRSFLTLVGISILLAMPIAWIAMDTWLGGFAYRINLDWWIFASAAIFSILIALLTIATQAIRLAVANPVKALRTE